MASRSLIPLRFLAPTRTTCPQRPACLALRRTFVSNTKPKATTPTTASTTTAAKPAATTHSKPPSAAAKPAAARTRLPQTTGQPLPDAPPTASPYPGDGNGDSSNGDKGPIDWTQSFHGLGTSAFGPEATQVLLARLDADDIEVKPDGIIYLPEIKYRRILNLAFGPGGWGLAPRGQLTVHDKLVTREYALVVHGRFVAQARGEQAYFSEEGVSTAAEGCKSNALMRCCKDLGIASELWDPRFIRRFMKEHAVQQWVEHVTTKKRKQIWLRKDDEVRYPFKKT